MNIGPEVLSIINALPDAVLAVERKRGKTIVANALFYAYLGISEDILEDVNLFHAPTLTKNAKRGLLRLFVKARSGNKDREEFTFPHVGADSMVKNFLATAQNASFAGDEGIVFTFRPVPREPPSGESGGSWESYLGLAYEPYLEFRPSVPLEGRRDQEDRTSYLKLLGENLKVKFANDAAVTLYRGENGEGLMGAPFFSFFNNQSDALRFLDMLSFVGQMKAETLVNAFNRIAQVEMRCAVLFGEEDSITALYCAQRDLTSHQHYAAIIGDSRREMNFAFRQPFTGFAFLAPPEPVERPQAENVDARLDEILNSITIIKANDAIVDIYKTEKSQFLMKPMRALFASQDTARQVMKELFVMRVTSTERYDESGDTLERVSIYEAAFDEADRMTGVLVATSKHYYGYKARHSNRERVLPKVSNLEKL
ncbi:MAG: PAS domain-containing protein [Synergistaceae bacterium]|jgi:PAS domain-containing protein|nr:PAS domain-containing protein [Synergistaceae bacterium]